MGGAAVGLGREGQHFSKTTKNMSFWGGGGGVGFGVAGEDKWNLDLLSSEPLSYVGAGGVDT